MIHLLIVCHPWDGILSYSALRLMAMGATPGAFAEHMCEHPPSGDAPYCVAEDRCCPALELGGPELRCYNLFKFLSNSPSSCCKCAAAVRQVAQRLMAVEVAHLLLSLLPDPYSPSSAILASRLPTTPSGLRVRPKCPSTRVHFFQLLVCCECRQDCSAFP